MNATLAVGVAGTVAICALAAALFRDRDREPLVSVELGFGTDLRREPVEAFLAACSGLRTDKPVVLDTVATETGIRHFLRADQATLDFVTGQLRVLAPSTRVEAVAPPPAPVWAFGARLAWGGAHAVLRTDGAEEAAAGLLAALEPLAADETVLFRVALYPGRPRLPREPSRAGDRSSAHRRDELSALRTKYSTPVLHTSVLLAIACGHPGRATHLAGRVSAPVRSRRGTLGHLHVRRLSQPRIQRALTGKPRRGVLLTPAELGGLIAWPIGAPRLPGLQLGKTPLLYPDRRIPTSGRIIALSTWPDAGSRALAQPVIGGLSHSLLAGPTGAGKSALMASLCLADVSAGRGLLVVDGKGDVVQAVLERIPANRRDDVIVLDPASRGPVPGLKVFGRGSDPELTADLVLGVLADVYKDSFGIRSAQWLRVALVTLAQHPKATLGDLPYVFTDEGYRRRLLGRVSDPLLLASWAVYDAMSPGEKANQTGPALTKTSELLARRVLRTVLSQQQPNLDLREALRRGRILLVTINPGRLGGPASRLLGALVLHALFTAVQARAELPAAKRTPFFAYLDEPRVLSDIPVPLDGLLERARSLGVGLTIATQSITTLPTTTRHAALTNAATLVAFRQTADDAELLARHLPGVTPDALQGLGPFEVIARIGLGPGDVTGPVTGCTLPLPAGSSDPTELRRESAARYGTEPASVDRALADRHGAGGIAARDDAPIGRKRRTP